MTFFSVLFVLSVNQASAVFYGILFAITLHHGLNECMEQNVYQVTHPKVHRYYSLTTFKEKFSRLVTFW